MYAIRSYYEILMSLTHPSYKVAAVQAAPAFLDLNAAVQKTIRYIREAASYNFV